MSKLFRPFQPTLTQSGLSSLGLSLRSSGPCFDLKGVVHSYLQICAAKPTPYPVMPDGTQAIFISPNGSIVGGAQVQACDIPILETGEYFGIRFYPGILRHFFNLDLAEITDQFVDSKYFPSKRFSNLHQALYQESSYQNRVSVCENWLLHNYRPQLKSRFDQALYLIYQSYGNIRVNELANTVGWSSRHLNRLFRLHTGLSTKTFSKIIRMQHVCHQLYTAPRNSPPHSGLELGFFDQSHLIKDFRRHLLSSPTTFFNRFMSDFYNR